MPENKGQIFEDQISTWLKKVEAGRKYNGEPENVAVTLARLPYWKGEARIGSGSVWARVPLGGSKRMCCFERTFHSVILDMPLNGLGG